MKDKQENKNRQNKEGYFTDPLPSAHTVTTLKLA